MRQAISEDQALEPCLIHLAAPRQVPLIQYGKDSDANLRRAWGMLKQGLSLTDVWKNTGVPQTTLSGMRTGKSKRHITGL